MLQGFEDLQNYPFDAEIWAASINSLGPSDAIWW